MFKKAPMVVFFFSEENQDNTYVLPDFMNIL